jgi:protoporphyrinogen oxidase
MQAIPLQIAAKLTAGTVIFNEKAMQINAGAVATHTGNIYTADNILIATPATCPLLHDHTPTSQYAHRSVVNVYFAAEKSPLSAPILALNANSNGNFFVENFCVISDIAPNYAPKGQHLVSVSVGGQHHHFTDDELVQRIKTELAPHFGYEVNTWDFIKTYRIQYALPNQTTVRNHADPADIKIGENLYRTGDYLLNGSINAALKAGRQAAEVILNNP